MFNSKSLLLIVFLALISAGCGTDGIDNTPNALSVSASTDDGIPDYVFSGNNYTYTLNIENGSATDINLTAFEEGGDWLQAKLVSNGSKIQLSGNIPNVDDQKEFGYSITALKEDEGNGVLTFSILVNN